MLRYAALLAVVGCTSRINPEFCKTHPDDTSCGSSDGATDDASALCLGVDTFAVCIQPPTMPATIAMDFDTDLGTECAMTQPANWKAAGQPDACFVIGTTVTLDMVRAHGGRPLIAVASDSITVTGLDVSSTRVSSTVGAGFDPSVCAAGMPPGTSTNGGGGGAGGTFFGSPGGSGGQGGGPALGGVPPQVATMPPTLLRGGCPGQVGAIGQAAGGAGGIGGGAVYLLAANQIDLSNATLNASGAGGDTGNKAAGGGGGGSGGMIVLHATTVGTTGATLLANGGGGGGGGAGGTGMAGSDPNPMMVTMPAAGGTGGSNGGGGAGFAGTSNAQGGQTGNGGCGGGGGGGGSGYIGSNHVIGTTMVSPQPTTM
jgi:hypothetical protein